MPSINEEEVPRFSQMTKATVQYTASYTLRPENNAEGIFGLETRPDADGFITDLRLVQTCTLNREVHSYNSGNCDPDLQGHTDYISHILLGINQSTSTPDSTQKRLSCHSLLLNVAPILKHHMSPEC